MLESLDSKENEVSPSNTPRNTPRSTSSNKGLPFKPVNNSSTLKVNHVAKKKKKLLVASSSSTGLNLEPPQHPSEGDLNGGLIRSRSSSTMLKPRASVRFHPQVQERIIYKQASKSVLLSQHLLTTLPPELLNYSGEPVQMEYTNFGNDNQCAGREADVVITPVLSEPIETHPVLKPSVTDGSVQSISPIDEQLDDTEYDFPSPSFRTPCVPPLDTTKIDRNNTLVQTEPNKTTSGPNRAYHTRSNSSPIQAPCPDEEFYDDGQRRKREICKLRSRSIDTAILENSKVIPKYMTLYGYELEFKSSLRAFDFNPSSWIQIMMDIPEGLNKFRKVVISRSKVQLHNFLPRWTLSFYLEDVFGGHKAPIEVQLWVLNHFREPILVGTTLPMIVEDLVFAKPGKSWHLNTVKKKTLYADMPISIVSSKKVPPQERSRFYSFSFQVQDISPILVENEACHVYLEILAVPLRSLRNPLDSPITNYVPIAKTEMTRSLNPQWEHLVIDTQACGGRFSLLLINLCTFNSDFRKVTLGSLSTTLHELGQVNHCPFELKGKTGPITRPTLNVVSVSPLGGDENDTEPNFFSFSFQALELDCETPFFTIFGMPSVSTSHPYHIDLLDDEKPKEQLLKFNEPLVTKRKSFKNSTKLAVNTIDSPRKTFFPNMLIYRSESNKDCVWHVDLDQSECGGLDRPIHIVFSDVGTNGRHTTLGSIKTTLRELSLKNSIFPIQAGRGKSNRNIGVFVVSGKTAQFCAPITPPKAFNVELLISGYPAGTNIWFVIRSQSYYSEKYSIALEATLHNGEMRIFHEFDVAKYGGFDRYFSMEIYKLSSKNTKVTALGQLLLTLREISFINQSGNTVYHIPNIYRNIRNRKWSKLQGVIEFVTVTPVQPDNNYIAVKTNCK